MVAFQFKQFAIHQDRCAMKIGTDGVLLGAWVSVNHHPFSVLDIGAGTGILALQMAQRTDAELIDAIEIDEDAYEQCVENFENSDWSDRLFCYHASLEEFVDEIDDQYDLIISNPPFYSENYKPNERSRDIARFTDALPFEELVESASRLLNENGVFAVVIPKKSESELSIIAAEFKLFPKRICYVKGHQNSEEKRVLMEFSFNKTNPIIEHLIIEKTRHNYTEEYKNLVKDFYLNM